MKSEDKIKLLKRLPKPEELKSFMPRLNGKRMLLEMIQNKDSGKIADITLIGILMGTVNMMMQNTPDWGEYIDPSNITDGEDIDPTEEEVPEPCGDPECKGCAELEKAIKQAKEQGGVIKAVRLTKKQAMEMGLIDEDGNDIKAGVGHCKDEDETSTGKVIH